MIATRPASVLGDALQDLWLCRSQGRNLDHITLHDFGIVQKKRNNQYISVAITKEGQFYVEGELTAVGSLAGAIRNAKNTKPEGTIVLRADKDATVDDAVRVLNIGKALNLKLVMATEQGSL